MEAGDIILLHFVVKLPLVFSARGTSFEVDKCVMHLNPLQCCYDATYSKEYYFFEAINN